MRRISTTFFAHWQSRYGLSQETTETVLWGFAARIPFSTLSAATGVATDQLSRLFSLPWTEAWVNVDELPPPKPPRPRKADWSKSRPEIVEAMAKLIAHGVNEKCVSTYLEVPAKHFRGYWKAAVELRRSQIIRRNPP